MDVGGYVSYGEAMAMAGKVVSKVSDPSTCVFCKRIYAEEYDDERYGAVTFVPLRPVTPGHRLVVPILHATDAGDEPESAANAFRFAAELLMGRQGNIITSAGRDATQSVFHTHIHIVPRKRGDGLLLPWSNQKS